MCGSRDICFGYYTRFSHRARDDVWPGAVDSFSRSRLWYGPMPANVHSGVLVELSGNLVRLRTGADGRRLHGRTKPSGSAGRPHLHVPAPANTDLNDVRQVSPDLGADGIYMQLAGIRLAMGHRRCVHTSSVDRTPNCSTPACPLTPRHARGNSFLL